MNNRDKKLLLAAGGILVLVLIFFRVFQPGMEEIEAMNRNNADLQERVSQLERLEANKEKMQEKTAEMEAEIKSILSVFPSDVREETAIVYANDLENQSRMEISAVGTGAPNLLYVAGEGQEGEASLYGRPVSYTFTSSYQEFKKAVQTIQQNPDKQNVENLTLSFDSSTGKLVGSMQTNFYAVSGTKKEYTAPETGNVRLGTTDIFGAVSSPGAETEEEAGTGEEE